MTTITLYGGPLKRDLINRAYGILGQSFTEFEIEPEEYDAGLMCLNDVMAALEDDYGLALGYNYPPNGNGSPDDESGIPRSAVKAVSYQVAQALAPSIGKALPADALAQLSITLAHLLSKAVIPQMEMGRGTPRGAGNRRLWQRTPFFFVDVSTDEIQQ